MSRMAVPLAARSTSSSWIWCLAPTSMPRVGSSATRTRGSPSSARANISFCWLPPDRVTAGASRALGPVTCAEGTTYPGVLESSPDEPEPTERGRLARLTFSRMGRPRHRPSSLRDSGMSATPASMPARGVPRVGRPPMSTRPEAIRLAPASARPSSERPAPTRPATPTISPARTRSEAPAPQAPRHRPPRAPPARRARQPGGADMPSRRRGRAWRR